MARQQRLHVHEPGDFVRQDVAAALAGGMQVIPVLLDRTAMPTEAQLTKDARRHVGTFAQPALADVDEHLRVAEGTGQRVMCGAGVTGAVVASVADEDADRGRAAQDTARIASKRLPNSWRNCLRTSAAA